MRIYRFGRSCVDPHRPLKGSDWGVPNKGRAYLSAPMRCWIVHDWPYRYIIRTWNGNSYPWSEGCYIFGFLPWKTHLDHTLPVKVDNRYSPAPKAYLCACYKMRLERSLRFLWWRNWSWNPDWHPCNIFFACWSRSLEERLALLWNVRQALYYPYQPFGKRGCLLVGSILSSIPDALGLAKLSWISHYGYNPHSNCCLGNSRLSRRRCTLCLLIKWRYIRSRGLNILA